MKTGLFIGSVLLAFQLSAFAYVSSLTAYPEYPAAIPRDAAYQVRVRQGATEHELPVYNRTEKSLLVGRTRGGDVNRRFCEFAFEGDPVTVEIGVRDAVTGYAVFPSRLGLRHSFTNGVLTVTVDRPCNFGIRFNDYDKTILSVFADAPEPQAEVPVKGASGVLYVDGWVDAPGRDGALEIGPETKEVYLAPGSVLNARLHVRGKGTFVHGRGMILDPLSDIFRYDQTKNTRRGLLTVGAPEVRVKDVKLVDARTFNYMCWQPDVRFENVKALSAMMCSDGITFGSKRFVCDGAWLYVGDNALVLSGGKEFAVSNVTIGTSCAAIFPQGSPEGRLQNIDIFRTDDGFLNNTYNGVLRRNNKWNEMNGGLQQAEPGPQDLVHQTCDLVFDDVSLLDCARLRSLFRGRNMGTKPKKYVFNRLTAPAPENKKTVDVQNDPAKWLVTDNYDITFNDLVLVTNAVSGVRLAEPWTPSESPVRSVSPDTNLVREIWPRQSVWQRVPSWLVKLETENGLDETNRIYKLVQCEKNAGMQAVVTEEALARGKGRYVLSFEAAAELDEGEGPLEVICRVQSNDWKVERRVTVGSDWASRSVDFDLPIDTSRDDLVGISLLATRPVATLRFRHLRFVSEKER